MRAAVAAASAIGRLFTSLAPVRALLVVRGAVVPGDALDVRDDDAPVVDLLVVQVRREVVDRGGVADLADELAPIHMRSLVDRTGLQVRVPRPPAVSVPDHDGVAVAGGLGV